MPDAISRYLLFPLLAISILAGGFLEETLWHRPKPTNQPKTYSAESQDVSTSKTENADDPAFSVKLIPPIKSEQEAADEANEKYEKRWNDWITIFVIGGGTLVILVSQLVVFGLQAHRLKQTIVKMDEVARGQTKDMGDSIREATRAADEMGKVATAINETVVINKGIMASQRDFWQRQMRAYMSIDIGTYFRQTKYGHWRFEFRPNIINNGQTPAYNVRVLSNCGLIESASSIANFDFTVNNENIRSSTTISPRQTKFQRIVFNRDATFSEIRRILRGELVFHVYGAIKYDDAFKEPRTTNFSFLILLPKNKRGAAVWLVTDSHNDAD